MFIKQVSIFVENKSGKLYDVIRLLGENNIDISALSIADTSDYGILRLIVDKPKKAVDILRDNDIVVRIDDVIALSVANTPGGLIKALGLLEKEDVDVNYLYAFVGKSGNDASVMLKVSDLNKAEEIFKKNNVALIDANEVQSY